MYYLHYVKMQIKKQNRYMYNVKNNLVCQFEKKLF
jgi:hypothetical protein